MYHLYYMSVESVGVGQDWRYLLATKQKRREKKSWDGERFLWILIGCDKRGGMRAEDYIILLSKWGKAESAF